MFAEDAYNDGYDKGKEDGYRKGKQDGLGAAPKIENLHIEAKLHLQQAQNWMLQGEYRSAEIYANEAQSALNDAKELMGG